MSENPEITIQEVARLRAIIKQAIWDLEGGRPDMALICLGYSGVGEEITELSEIIENEPNKAKLEHLLAARIVTLLKENNELRADAERYRWLKATDQFNLCAIAYRVPEACKYNKADECIDAAIKNSL